MNTISGSCLCGAVTFHCDNRFDDFDLCHCTQCRKATGSAFVPNLFTAPDNIHWDAGADKVRRYDVPGRSITNAFCNECGGALPYVSKGGRALIVPAGCLDGNPALAPQAHIFWSERAAWYESSLAIPRHDRFKTS